MTKSVEQPELVEQTEQFISIVEDILPADSSSHNLSTDDLLMPDPVLCEDAHFYEVHNAGPLTYFQYYFETAGVSAGSPKSLRHSNFSVPLRTGLIGAGLVGASAAVGFFAVKTIKSQPFSFPEKSGKPSEPSRQQNPVKSAVATNIHPPEQINPIQAKSISNSSSFSQKTKSNVQQPSASKTTSQQKSQQNLPIYSANENLSVLLDPLLQLSPPPAQPSEKATPSNGTRQTQVSLKSAKAAKSANRSIASPETLIVKQPQTLSSPSTSLPALQPLAPSTSLHGSLLEGAPKDLAESSLKNYAVADRNSALLPQGETFQSLAKPINPTEVDSPRNRLIDIDQILGSAQSLQELLNLPQVLPESIRTIAMPLTKQAATEAEQNDIPNPFTFRKLGSTEYRNEWLQTAGAFNAKASERTLPSYGFINYQRRVIVVPQRPSLATTISPNPKVVLNELSKNR